MKSRRNLILSVYKILLNIKVDITPSSQACNFVDIDTIYGLSAFYEFFHLSYTFSF